jgi:hypothetical protein
MTKTTLETIWIQVVAFVVLAACALAFGLGRPAPARADRPERSDRVDAVQTVAIATSSVCWLDGAPRCTATR